MGSEIQWWVWLLGGLGTGLIPLFGASRALGIVQAAVVIGAPFFIFMNGGAKLMPFIAFYGGLMVTSSFLFKRKTAQEDRQRKSDLAAKKQRWG